MAVVGVIVKNAERSKMYRDNGYVACLFFDELHTEAIRLCREHNVMIDKIRIRSNKPFEFHMELKYGICTCGGWSAETTETCDCQCWEYAEYKTLTGVLGFCKRYNEKYIKEKE